MKAITTKQDLILNMQRSIGFAGYMSWNQIAKYVGVSKNNERERARLTNGLRFLQDGRGKKYRVVDVAERLLQLESIEVARYES